MSDKKLTDANMSAIDKAIANAKARKATKGTGDETSTAKPVKEPKAPKLSDEEKAAKLAKREIERAEAKTARDALRAAKIAERNANRAPAHMRKVQKAAEKLASLGQAAELLFNEATANLPAADLAALATHIQHFNRVKATERALGQKLEVGQSVTIVAGEPRFVGKIGTLSKVQRIRCYVDVEGLTKPVYLFTSDVVLNAAASAAATA